MHFGPNDVIKVPEVVFSFFGLSQNIPSVSLLSYSIVGASLVVFSTPWASPDLGYSAPLNTA